MVGNIGVDWVKIGGGGRYYEGSSGGSMAEAEICLLLYDLI